MLPLTLCTRIFASTRCIAFNVLLQLMPATVTELAALAAATELAALAAATEACCAAARDSSAWWQHNKLWGRSGACFLP